MKALKSRKICISLFILAFMMVSTMGVLSMGTMHDGSMENCPFMGVAAICNMTPLQHVVEWQQMFASIPQQVVTFGLLLLLSLFLLARLHDDFSLRKRLATHRIYYRYREPEVFDPMRLAFARGLIHPKIF